MQIFLDTGDIKEIARWLAQGVIDGITTNPSIMLSAGHYELRTAAREIARLAYDLPVCVEVVSDDPEDMILQARDIAAWADNIVVKIPIITTTGVPCLRAIHALEREGIRVNATACLSFGQAILAAKAGATYVSIFAGRISDEGGDASLVVRNTADWLARWKDQYAARIIVGSMRSAGNVQEAVLAGAHVVTVPPKFLQQLVDHKYSRVTVQQFLSDGYTAQQRMGAMSAAGEGALTPTG